MMSIQDYTPQDVKISFDYKPKNSDFGEKIKDGFRKAGTFIYETPLWVVASAIIGIAFLIFYPPYAAPFLGVVGATVLTRIVVKIIETFNPKQLKISRENIFKFQQKHPYILYLAIITSLVVTAFCPIGGAVISSTVGIYKGMVVEIDIFKYKQNIRREEFKNPISDSKVNIINC